MTENQDVQLPKTPGMDNVPRDQSAKGTPERKQPPTPPPKTTFKPAVPKFGNVTEIAKDSWITWTGGKPNKDWTGLEDPTPKSVEPNQHRSTSISSQSKSQCHGIKGLEYKFKKNSDSQTFQKDIKDHLVDHGLDTIACMPDPADEDKLVSVMVTS